MAFIAARISVLLGPPARRCFGNQWLQTRPLRIPQITRGIASLPGTFVLKRGTPKIYIKTAESGTKRAHGFCPECGTPLYSTSPEANPQSYGLRVGGSTSAPSSAHRRARSGAAQLCRGR